MRVILNMTVFMAAALLLSGCLYPQERKVENTVPYEDQIEAVQTAVDKYREANGGLLPIKTRDMETPIYSKYPIEFSKLEPRFLSTPPGNAFENGGVFQYVLIDVETNPTVKVFDLRIAERIREVKMRIRTQGYPPFKENIAKDVYTLDFQKLGYKGDQYIVSPYTNNNLPLVITTDGELFVDYASDIYLAMQAGKHTFQPGDDIRSILTEESVVVPAYSFPYTIDENNEPVYMAK